MTTSTNGAASTGARFTLNRFSPQAVSEALCLRAKSVYEDQRAVSSPFQQRAMEEGIHFAGGKRDDVTCVVASVSLLFLFLFLSLIDCLTDVSCRLSIDWRVGGVCCELQSWFLSPA